MAIDTGCYMVKINTFPFKPGEEEPVGCYKSLEIARKVCEFITNGFSTQVSGGIDTSIDKISDDDAVHRKIYFTTALSGGERKRLNEALRRIVKPDLLLPGNDILDDISD